MPAQRTGVASKSHPARAHQSLALSSTELVDNLSDDSDSDYGLVENSIPSLSLPEDVAEATSATSVDESELREAVAFGEVAENPMFQMEQRVLRSSNRSSVPTSPASDIIEVSETDDEGGMDAELSLLGQVDEFEGIDLEAIMDEASELQNEDDVEAAVATLARLPPHFRCACHTLNLVAGDVDNFLKSEKGNPSLTKTATRVFNTLTRVWAKQGRSVLASDEIKEAFGRLFVVPGKTRWNLVFDACCVLEKLLAKPEMEESFNKILDQNKLPNLTGQFAQFLKEFVAVMKPLACSLDRLQGEGGSSGSSEAIGLGSLIPNLMSIINGVNSVLPTLKQCGPMAKYLLERLQERFKGVLQSEEHIAAALCHPKYKDRWIGAWAMVGEPYRGSLKLHPQECKAILKKFVEIYNSRPIGDDAPEESASDGGYSSVETDFLSDLEMLPRLRSSVGDFGSEAGASSSASEQWDVVIDGEIAAYFADKKIGSREIQSLTSYPHIPKVYKALNTTLPASAAIERVFSLCGRVLTPTCTALLASHFEACVFLKVNEKFEEKLTLSAKGKKRKLSNT